MLTLSVGNSDQLFIGECLIPFVTEFISSADTSNPDIQLLGDPVMAALSKRSFGRSTYSLNEVVGYPSGETDSNYDFEVSGYVPDNYGYSPMVDRTYFTSFFGRYNEVLYGRAFPSARSFSREKSCFHLSYQGRGSIVGSSTSFYSLDSTTTVLGQQFPVSTSGVRYRIYRNSIGQFDYISAPSVPYKGPWVEVLNANPSWVNVPYTNYGRNAYITVTDLLLHEDKFGFYGTWKYKVRRWGIGLQYSSPSWYEFTVERTLTVDVKRVPFYVGTIPASGMYDLRGVTTHVGVGTTIVNTYTNDPVNYPLNGDNYRTYYHTGTLTNQLILSSPVNDISAHRKFYPRSSASVRKQKLDGRIDALYQGYLHGFPEILGTTFYSSANAVEEHIELLKTNHLETLKEAGEILSLLPDLGLIVNIIRDAKSIRLLSAGKKVVDLVTGSHLQWVFGQKPTFDAIVEFSVNYDRIVARLEGAGMWGHKVLNGKFIYTVPHNEGPLRVGDVIITRSKVDLDQSHSTLLQIFLGASAVGLIPSLSGLWELFPMSFIVDWFYGTGRRLKDIDTRMAMLALNVQYCVHSITIHRPFTGDELDLYGILPDLGSSPGLKLYDRIVSRRSPPLRNSIYDFRAVTGVPSISTAGSLFYQIVS